MIAMRPVVLALAVTSALAGASHAAGPARVEIAHAGHGHDVHVSAPAVAVGRDGLPVVAWIAAHGESHVLYLARGGRAAAPVGREAAPVGRESAPVRVSPEGLTVESLHQAPGLAVGPNGEIYVTWSSSKPRPAGAMFASDLQLSRSLDGGATFEPPLRVNEDRPISHSFEGLAVAPDGTVLVAWIDSREGNGSARTYLARVVDRGTRVENVVTLDREETCVCCRVDVAARGDRAAVLWRKVFPDSVRDMVVATSADGGRSFATPAGVHADGWKITACPHRGGSLGMDAKGALHAAWYTEGRRGEPAVMFAAAADGRRFRAPKRLDTPGGSIPDHVRLAVDGGGRAVVIWEDATAVRRRILARASSDGGRTWSQTRVLSSALKSFEPAVVARPGGGFVAAWHEEHFPVIKTVVLDLQSAR